MICQTDGCDRTAKARGLCQKHYLQYRRSVGIGRSCSIDDCTGNVIARGWCEMHYERWRTYGDPLAERPERLCSVDGCERRHDSNGYCHLHDYRFRAHGDPLMVVKRRVEGGGYMNAHRVVRVLKGKASEYVCVEPGCERQASDWAYDHSDPDEATDHHGTFSRNPDHYQPMCRSHHFRMDRAA